MKPELAKYENMKICVAVSGGRDSMALLHYLSRHARDYGIALSALNCDHGMRGESSARDSAFVKEWCRDNGVPLLTFEWGEAVQKTETRARNWRLCCYKTAMRGVDAIATAHHADDNAETVLFRLARGSSLSGLTGITDENFGDLRLIRPLISCTREQIDAYILENDVPFVEDETNSKDDYTRNKIRHNVLPALGEAVHGAAGAIYRFSRLAADDERYFDDLIAERKLVKLTDTGAQISFCAQAPVFRRAALKALALLSPAVKDYTAEHLERLYELQFCETSKKFVFLGFTAYSENGSVAVEITDDTENESAPFSDYLSGNCGIFGGQLLEISAKKPPERAGFKVLRFDPTAIPEGAVVRFMQAGDKFTKFGGGTKSLGDFFTDRKLPVRVRKRVPLIAIGADILAVCGVEISEKVKVTGKSVAFITCKQYEV